MTWWAGPAPERPALEEGGLLWALARGRPSGVPGLFPLILLSLGAEQVTAATAPGGGAGPSSDEPFQVYTIQRGDTLAAISARTGVSLNTLLWNNPAVKASPNLLQVGQEIVVPRGDGLVYTVRLGDTLFGIAGRYSVDVDVILRDNGLTNPDALVNKQVLFLRGAEPPPPPRPAPAAALAPLAPPPAGASASGFAWPVGGSITEYFGAPRGPGVYHLGLDIATRVPVPVAASAAGQVVYVARVNWGYGWHVIISHGDGYETLYGHLSRIDVGLGQRVGRGQVVGLTGSTGYSTGTHLHFEVRRNGRYLNPLALLP